MRNRALVEPLAIGTTSVTLYFGHVIIVKDYLFLPDVFWNIVSIPRLIKDGCELSFCNNVFHIHYCNEVVGTCIMVNDLYILELHESIRQRDANVATTNSGKRSRNNDVDPKQLWDH